MFEFISKLSFNRAVSIGLIIFGSIVSPYWFIYQFAPHIYINNNLIQLIIICAAVSVPPLLVFSFLTYKFSGYANYPDSENPKIQKKIMDDRVSMLVATSLISGMSFYVPSVMSFIGVTVNLKHAQEYVVYLHIGFVGLFSLLHFFDFIDHFIPNKKKKPPVE